MGVKSIDDLVAYQFATEFKLATYQVLNSSAAATRDLRFKGQLQGAASGVESNISEGFHRFNPAENEMFLGYALASLGEARTRLIDGVHRGYYPVESCNAALVWTNRCRDATKASRASQARLAAERRRKRDARGTK